MVMQVERQYKRMDVEIPVTVTTVLESFDASLVDLSEGGALVTGCAVPECTRFQIEYMGQTLYAQCRWSEIDRMGIKFLFPLVDGPLHERLQVARAASLYDDGPGLGLAMAPLQGGRGIMARARTFGRRN